MKLKDWLVFKCISVPKFCKYNDFCEESVYTYLKGGVPRSNIALKIVKATGGEVTLEELGLDQTTINKICLCHNTSLVIKHQECHESTIEKRWLR